MRLKRLCVILMIFTFLTISFGLYMVKQQLPNSLKQNEIVLRMAVPYSEKHPSSISSHYFSKIVKEKTKNRIQIQVYTDSELGDQKSTIDQLEFGGIAFSVVSTTSLPEKASYITNNYTLMPDEKCLSEMKINLLTMYQPDYRCIANNICPIKTNMDIKGQILQTDNSIVLKKILEQEGFIVNTYKVTDLIASLRYGYINGVEMNFIEFISSDISEELPYLNIYNGFKIPDIILSSQVSLGKLPNEDQKILKECADLAADYHKEILKKSQEIAINKFKPEFYEIKPENII